MILAERLLGIGILSVGSLFDIRKRWVPGWYILASMILSCIFSFFIRRTEIMQMMIGFLIGMFFFFLARYLGRHLGKGDGLVLSCAGVLVGGRGCLLILMVASVCAAFLGMCLLFMKRVNGKISLPFLPFIMIGFVVYEIWGR